MGGNDHITRSTVTKFYPESRYGGFTDIDGTIVFYNRVNALIKAGDIVLDIGCGRGAFMEDGNEYRKRLRNLRGKVKQVIGIDVDPKGESNPSLDEFRIVSLNQVWPIEDEYIDLAVSDQVLEHIEQPEGFFAECRRVLKDQGYLCIRTTNKWGYSAVGARLLPVNVQKRVLKKVKEQIKEEDVFPLVFRCNTRGSLRVMLDRFSFEGVVYGYSPEPGYLANWKAGYAAIRLYNAIIPGTLKANLFIFARKRPEG